MAIETFPSASGSTESTLNAPWGLQVARGLVSGATSINIFAAAANVSTTTQTMWEGLPTAYAFPATAIRMNVASTSAVDTGTAKIFISGLDANWALLTETVTMNGTTNVLTTGTFLRINSITMLTPASGQTSNVGVITVKNPGSGVVYAQMAATYGRSAMSLYSVPAGYTLYVTNINAYSGDANGTSWVVYRARTTNNNVTPANTITALDTTFNANYQVLRTNPFPYTQKSDVQWQFAVNSGTHSVGLILEAVLMLNTAP